VALRTPLMLTSTMRSHSSVLNSSLFETGMAGVVTEHVERAVGVHQLLDAGVDGGRVRDVHLQDECLAALAPAGSSTRV
jgi:hypothetical protein